MFLLMLSISLVIIAASSYLFWVIESKYIKIPEPIVTLQDPFTKKIKIAEIPLVIVRIEYNSRFKQKYNFCGGEQSLIDIILNPTIALPNDEISILFREKPLYCVVFERQKNGNYKKVSETFFEQKSEYIKTPSFNLPSEPGIYVYSLMVDYSFGRGVYYFSIKVVDDKTDDIK